MEKVTGIVTGVNGNLITAEFDGSVKKNEVCYVIVGDERLKGEVIRITNGVASMQVYEMTNGVKWATGWSSPVSFSAWSSAPASWDRSTTASRTPCRSWQTSAASS